MGQEEPESEVANSKIVQDGVKARLAFVGRGTLRNISLCEVGFSSHKF